MPGELAASLRVVARHWCPWIPLTRACAPQPGEEVPSPIVPPTSPLCPLEICGGPAPRAHQISPARFPPLASVTGAGAEMGGARGRHKCATAASSLSRLHPSRLLMVALATSYRWGIYRGGRRVLGSRRGGTGTGWASAWSASSFRLVSACVAVRRQEGCCSPWPQRARWFSFSCSSQPEEMVRNLCTEIKISIWVVCLSHRHRSCL